MSDWVWSLELWKGRNKELTPRSCPLTPTQLHANHWAFRDILKLPNLYPSQELQGHDPRHGELWHTGPVLPHMHNPLTVANGLPIFLWLAVIVLFPVLRIQAWASHMLDATLILSCVPSSFPLFWERESKLLLSALTQSVAHTAHTLVILLVQPPEKQRL